MNTAVLAALLGITPAIVGYIREVLSSRKASVDEIIHIMNEIEKAKTDYAKIILLNNIEKRGYMLFGKEKFDEAIPSYIIAAVCFEAIVLMVIAIAGGVSIATQPSTEFNTLFLGCSTVFECAVLAIVAAAVGIISFCSKHNNIKKRKKAYLDAFSNYRKLVMGDAKSE